MSHSKSKILISSALIVVFSAFNVGLPVVKYLCPLMNMDEPACPMAQPNHTLSISDQTPSCCAKIIGAERNTTPFLKANSPQLNEEKTILHTIVTGFNIFQTSFLTISNLKSSPPHTIQNLFLLNSTLLI